MKLSTREKVETKKLKDLLSCGICKNILRHPHVITECLDTFCQDCVVSLRQPDSNCPVCLLHLGPSPNQYIHPDPTLESIIIKLFPGLMETPIERPTKKVKQDTPVNTVKNLETREDCLVTECLPFQVKLDHQYVTLIRWIKEEHISIPDTTLKLFSSIPLLKVSKDTTIQKLKKNLKKKHGIDVMDIYCGQVHLGDEWSLEYCYKIAWFSNDPIELLVRCFVE